MENREFLEQIQQYAVRIGNAGDKELYGSGTLFLVSKRKKVCVLTAAHVVYSLMEKIKKQELKICLTCKDKKDDIHCIIVDDTKCICIYSEYNKNKRKKEFFNDLALIDIPWESWMDDMTGFRLASGNSGVEIKGYGFPLSLDEEKDRSLADLFAGIECLTGTIESQNVGRLAIKYDVHTGSDIERDSIMEGYSGTGLFSLETDGICYRGLVSCSRGDKTAGYTMWATDAGKITELMKENNIEIECPESFEPYGKLVADEFSEYKKNSKRIWNGATYKLIKNQGISPKDFEVQTRSVFLCAGERKLCDEFWKGKLKELVVMKEIQEVACEELINPIMQLPSRCGGKDVVLKFLCTEYKAEYILGKMIEDRQFAKDGEYRNNMILLVNSPKGHDNHMTIIPRADCRSIMTDIADDSTCIEELSELTENILGEDQKNAEFDIIKQKVSECDTEIANLQELKKQACIFENFSPEGMEKSINTWEKEKKNYEAQLELLYEMREENGARTYFEKYTAICKKIENQNKNLENKVLQIRKVKKSYEIEKNTLEMKLKDYFSQTIMNEIYQKIDPHEIMKNVTYHLNFNEKDEPQLFIEVCEGEESSKEVYRPETYFSTAQLNTVAFSSFFGRALSTNNLPVKTICIDDPIGHFDDMNILGFTDMVRCILEKQDCQIIMSTHEEKVYQIMKRKLDPNFYNTLFIQLDNSEKVIWNRANC